MNFDIPQDLQDYLDELDRFIADTIKPLENENDNIRFSTIGGKMLVRTGSAEVCLTKSGRLYWQRPSV